MNGPITTSCSHTFCHMCLDEAILFSPCIYLFYLSMPSLQKSNKRRIICSIKISTKDNYNVLIYFNLGFYQSFNLRKYKNLQKNNKIMIVG
jgi:hypothetical protein